jgi:hypothetical protein
MNGSESSWHAKLGTLVLLAGSVCLSGCSTLVSSPSSTTHARAQQHANEDMEARAERVFVYESRIADALLDRYPLREDFAAADPALVAAEAHMTEVCGVLTRAVLRHLEGREQSVKQKLKVARSLSSCEEAARRIEVMLEPSSSNALIATGGP